MLTADRQLQPGDAIAMDFGPDKLDSQILLDYGLLDQNTSKVYCYTLVACTAFDPYVLCVLPVRPTCSAVGWLCMAAQSSDSNRQWQQDRDRENKNERLSALVTQTLRLPRGPRWNGDHLVADCSCCMLALVVCLLDQSSARACMC